MTLDKLKQYAANKIAEQEAATEVKGYSLKTNDESAPRFYVLKLELEEGVAVTLSGAKPLIPLQASLVKAFDDLIKYRLNPDWTIKQFWAWVKDFEGGFLDFSVGARGELAKRIKEKTPWGRSFDSRPRILEVNKPSKKSVKKTVKNSKKKLDKDEEKIFYKSILLYPDRTEDRFEIFSAATYREISVLIVNWWNQKSSKGEVQAGRSDDIKMLSKHPKIYLHFEEDRPKNGARPKRGSISFRLMNYMDTSIAIADLKKLAIKIKEIFGRKYDEKPGYLWEKGRRYANYNHWEMGYKMQILSSTVKEGERLIGDILKIQGHEFKKARMSYSQNQAEAEAFPAKPGKKRILGEEIDLPARRPLCKVRFKYAAVEIGSLNQKIVIFSLDANNPIDSRLRG